MNHFSAVLVGLALTFQVSQAGSLNTLAEHRVGEVVVKIKKSNGFTAEASALNAISNLNVLDIRTSKTNSQFHTIRIANEQDLSAAITALNSQPSVEYAEPNYIYRTFQVQASATPNDTDFAKLWGMQNTGQPDPKDGQVGKAGVDIDVTRLWDMGITGKLSTLIAVIDTGVDFTHPDLAANIFTNAGEVAGNGKDDDNNGFVDDVHGYDFANNKGNGMDDHYHGTHCAGTIAGVGNNGTGVAGVNWNASVLPVKFLAADGSGTLEHAVQAIQYATLMKANVMSNSWGGGGFSQALKDAIQEASNKGIVFVAAAGNDSSNNDAAPTYPASYDVPNVIAVAAIDNLEKKAYFTNYGAKSVHVAAPGVNIYSTAPNNSYKVLSGTSMATPHVSGIVGLLLSHEPTLTPTDVRERLVKTSVRATELKKVSLSKGRVSAYNAVMNVVPPNDDPDDRLWKDASGAAESDHPYANKFDKTWTFNFPGASFIRVVFEKVDTEAKYDVLKIKTPAGEVVDEISGKGENLVTEYVKGDTILVNFLSDSSVNGYGFKISKIQVISP